MIRARELRANSTNAEKKLWDMLRRKQIKGFRFRRQYPLGPYFADFVCLPARLVIEVDGGQHAEPEQEAHDRRRTMWLKRERFRELRFWNLDVLKNSDGVLEAIEAAIRATPPPNVSRKARSICPLPQGEGGVVFLPSRKGRVN